MKLLENKMFMASIVLGCITYLLTVSIHIIVDKIKARKKKDEYNNL